VAAGALGFAACALVAGGNWLDFSGMRGQTGELRAQTDESTREYQRITSAFPVTQTTTDNLRATVIEFGNLARRTAAPRDALVYASQVLNDFPQIELDSLQWRLERSDERAAAAPSW